MTTSSLVPNYSSPSAPARPGTNVDTELASSATCPAGSYPTPVQPSHDPLRTLTTGLILSCWSTLIVACGAGVMTFIAAQRALDRYGPAPALRRLQARGRRPYRHRARHATAVAPIFLPPQSPPAPPPLPPCPREAPAPPLDPLARIA